MPAQTRSSKARAELETSIESLKKKLSKKKHDIKMARYLIKKGAEQLEESLEKGEKEMDEALKKFEDELNEQLRKSSSDENDDKLDCKICMSSYEESGEKMPMIYDCGHSICKDCSTKVDRNYNGDIVCPFCRAKSRENVKTNKALVSLLSLK